MDSQISLISNNLKQLINDVLINGDGYSTTEEHRIRIIQTIRSIIEVFIHYIL